MDALTDGRKMNRQVSFSYSEKLVSCETCASWSLDIFNPSTATV